MHLTDLFLPSGLGESEEVLYIFSMSSAFPYIMLAAMGAVLASLFIGLYAMGKGGEAGARLSQRMMRWRVALQAGALVIFVIGMSMGR